MKNGYNYFLLLALILTSFGANAQDCFKKDPFEGFRLNRAYYNLKGPVKAAEEFNYQQFVPDSLLISFVTDYDQYFDSSGREIIERTRLEKGRFHTEYRYKYDDKDHYTEFLSVDSTGNQRWVYLLEFDYKKNSFKKISKNGTQVFIEENVFDSSGNLLLLKNLAPQQSIFASYKYEYNKMGLPVKVIEYGKDLKKIVRKKEFLYNIPDKILTIRFFSSEGNFLYAETYSYGKGCKLLLYRFDFGYTTFSYDDYGNTIEVKHIVNGEERYYSSYSYRYEYDSYGNWVQKETYSKDNVLISRVQRKISYY